MSHGLSVSISHFPKCSKLVVRQTLLHKAYLLAGPELLIHLMVTPPTSLVPKAPKRRSPDAHETRGKVEKHGPILDRGHPRACNANLLVDPFAFLHGGLDHAPSKVRVRRIQRSVFWYVEADPNFTLRRAWHDPGSTKEDNWYPRIIRLLEESSCTLKVEVDVLSNTLEHLMKISGEVSSDAPIACHSC
jgi:hypothetical protein